MPLCKRTQAAFDAATDEAMSVVFVMKLVFFCRALAGKIGVAEKFHNVVPAALS